MIRYTAYIDPTPRVPGVAGPVLESNTLAGLKSKFDALQIDWPQLEWPKRIEYGTFFHARGVNAGIEIYKRTKARKCR